LNSTRRSSASTASSADDVLAEALRGQQHDARTQSQTQARQLGANQIVEHLAPFHHHTEVTSFLITRGGVFSKRGMSLERPDLGDARSVDPL
jgi:hypothetical protein